MSTPRGLRALALLLLTLGLLPVGTGPAAAHAALVSSDPRDGARLERLPGGVALTFTEEVSTPAYVVVRASDGRQLTSGDPDVEGVTVSQTLDSTRAGSEVSGEVTVAYRVVSVDGHPVTGEVAFTVVPASGSAGDPAGGDEDGDEDGGEGAASSAAADGPTEADGFQATHGSHYLVGGFLVLVAGGLLWVARGRARS